MVHYDSYLLTYLSKGLARAVSPATRKQRDSLIKSIEDVKEERVNLILEVFMMMMMKMMMMMMRKKKKKM